MPAWTKADDSDWYQERLDGKLREAFDGEDFPTFQERYPMFKQYSYKEQRWK